MQNAKNILIRLLAFIVDFIILRILYLLNDQIIGMWKRNIFASGIDIRTNVDVATQVLWVHFALQIFVMLAYFTLCDGILLKASVGKLITKLRVTRLDNQSLSFGISLCRSTVKMLPFILMMALGEIVLVAKWHNAELVSFDLPTIGTIVIAIFAAISYGFAFTNKDRQTLHDKMAKTTVVKI
jgi:uncharacterized RDD family membrane protein YckC